MRACAHDFRRAWAGAAALLLLASCNRNDTTAGAPPAAAPAASAAAAAASAPPAAASATVLMPQQVPSASVSATEDTSAGRQLAAQGANGVAACAGCHGANGEGNAQTGFPRLAGLGKTYLEHQLASYASGTRSNPIMSPIAAAMTPAQRGAAAVYFARLDPAPGATGPAAAAGGAAAPQLAAVGDDRRNIQGCANCHGPQGIGDGAANPYLAGQHAAYLKSALAEWKIGARRNDPSGQMPAIAKALTDAEVQALVSYYSGLPPPPARAVPALAAAASPARQAVESGPVAETAPAQGIGTQQGAPLTGGSQGQGSTGTATNPAQAGAAVRP